MKKVDATFRDKISDLILENELSISEFALEKDFIVTDVLQAISKINNEKFNLVFCGGTCLSKAYGLLERVSEDVDIKLVPKLGVILNANQRRTAISRLKKDIVQALLNIGFEEGNIQQIALDGNTCVEFNAEYSTYFDVEHAMRAAMKLELNYTNLSLPSVDMDMGLLFDELAGIKTHALKMQCVDIREALTEKLISFPRRLAMHLTDPDRFKFDQALVRHLFDVHRIIERNPKINEDVVLKSLLLSAMDKDAKDFMHQYPKFLTNPVGEIQNAMSVAKSKPEYRKMYGEFVKAMVYSKEVPSFEDAIMNFDTVLTALLPSPNTNFNHHAAKLSPARYNR
jgi:predicted nucleotidyltransferase component of viral defense system